MELEMIYTEMEKCGNDVHTACENLTEKTSLTVAELLEIYDQG